MARFRLFTHGVATVDGSPCFIYHRFYTGCPSWCNPPIYLGFGTSTTSRLACDTPHILAMWLLPVLNQEHIITVYVVVMLSNSLYTTNYWSVHATSHKIFLKIFVTSINMDESSWWFSYFCVGSRWPFFGFVGVFNKYWINLGKRK